MQDLTQLLQAWQNGDPEAIHKLIPLVYRELHRIAGRYMRRQKEDSTFQTTALVHEAYCKLVDQKRVQWQRDTEINLPQRTQKAPGNNENYKFPVFLTFSA